MQEKQLSIFEIHEDGIIRFSPGADVTLRATAQVALSNFLLNGQFRLNSIEWKLFFAMIACIEEEDTEFTTYNIRVKEIIDLAGLKSGNHLYEEIDGNIKSLMSHVVSWEISPGVLDYANLVAKARYFKKHGVVQLTPHPDLKPHLLKLKQQFTQAQLRYCMGFSSPYISRLYMLLKQFDSPEAGYRVMGLQELRFKLGLDYTQNKGKKEVPVSVYQDFYDIRRFILDPARRELAHTDIPFDYTTSKTGRKITGLKFVLKAGKKLRLALPKPKPPQLSEEQARLYSALQPLGFTDHQIRKILESGTPEEISKVTYEVKTTDYNKLGKPIANKKAYAYGIFKKKFGLT